MTLPMLLPPTPQPTPLPRRALPERLHLNTADVVGTLTRVWSADGAVFARLKATAPNPFAVTLCLPHGQLHGGGPVSLLTGSTVRVTGFLREAPYTETLGTVLERAGLPHLAQPGDEARVLKRISTFLIAEALQPAPPETTLNTAQIEGVITRTWNTRSGDACARLAVYDRHAEKAGARRQAHYVAVRIPGGKTADGQPVRFALKQRVLIPAGRLLELSYVETLQDVLSKVTPARDNPLSPEVDPKRQVQRRSALYVAASTLIVFSK